MIKDRHTYRIGDVLYEVDPFNREIVKHTITDIYLYSMDRGNVLVQILSDNGGAYSWLAIHDMFNTREEAERERERLVMLDNIVAGMHKRDNECSEVYKYETK